LRRLHDERIFKIKGSILSIASIWRRFGSGRVRSPMAARFGLGFHDQIWRKDVRGALLTTIAAAALSPSAAGGGARGAGDGTGGGSGAALVAPARGAFAAASGQQRLDGAAGGPCRQRQGSTTEGTDADRAGAADAQRGERRNFVEPETRRVITIVRRRFGSGRQARGGPRPLLSVPADVAGPETYSRGTRRATTFGASWLSVRVKSPLSNCCQLAPRTFQARPAAPASRSNKGHRHGQL